MPFRASALRKETATGLINSGFLSDRDDDDDDKVGGRGRLFQNNYERRFRLKRGGGREDALSSLSLSLLCRSI